MHERLSCAGALAVELSPGTRAQAGALDRHDAGELAALMARDLAKFAPRAAELDLAVVAGLFDPVELLRPGYPLHAELTRLIAQAPGHGQARVIAFAASAGELPEPLRPDPHYAGGPLRLLPFGLHGDAELVAEVGRQLEDTLLDTGMAGADTALLAQEKFAAVVEHARYLTLHDLAAMTAMQYEHAGLGPLWPLIEAALLRPGNETWLDAPPEPLARYGQGEVRMALLDIDTWLEAGFAPRDTGAEQLSRAFERYLMRQRQFTAVLSAHGIAVSYDHCPKGSRPQVILSECAQTQS
jgi:hypothetical protein